MAMDRSISIYEPITSKSVSGMETITYRKLLAVPNTFAEVTWQTSKAKERDEGKQRVATTTAEFRIRYRADLTQAMIIYSEGLYYDIMKINPLDRRRFLLVEAEEKDNDWSIPI